jgi:hypothetical protein
MKPSIFLSHDHRDSNVAHVLANCLSRVTLQQLDVWFSSDSSPSGGMEPGVWLDNIRGQLLKSKAIVVLLTATSVDRPWLMFETGFGAANPVCDIIPVCVGINSRDVPFPLGMYQAYQLADYESLKLFAARILKRYEIFFDEDLSRPVLEKAISEIIEASPKIAKATKISTVDVVAELKNYFYHKILDLYKAMKLGNEEVLGSFSFSVQISFPKLQTISYLDVEANDSVQDVLDSMYYMLASEVAAFTYLSAWILQEVKTGKYLVLREVADRIPAEVIFFPNSEWRALLLDKPYSPKMSSDAKRWYRTDDNKFLP